MSGIGYEDYNPDVEFIPWISWCKIVYQSIKAGNIEMHHHLERKIEEDILYKHRYDWYVHKYLAEHPEEIGLKWQS